MEEATHLNSKKYIPFSSNFTRPKTNHYEKSNNHYVFDGNHYEILNNHYVFAYNHYDFLNNHYFFQSNVKIKLHQFMMQHFYILFQQKSN
jgi:hypothetical protein